MWVIAALGILAIGTLTLHRTRGRGGLSDLGCVSQHWLAEQRASQLGQPR
jgi:hypothetical protein